jgi:hypothetical protein
MRLGELLLSEKLITRAGLEEALEDQVVHGGRLGTNLLELGLVQEKDLARMLGKQQNVSYAAGEMVPDPRVLRMMDPNFCDDKDVLPMRMDATRITVAVLNPNDLKALDEVAYKTGKRVVPVIITEFRMNQLLRRHCKAFRTVRSIDMGKVRPSKTLGTLKESGPSPVAGDDLINDEEFQKLYAKALAGGATEEAPAAAAAPPMMAAAEPPRRPAPPAPLAAKGPILTAATPARGLPALQMPPGATSPVATRPTTSPGMAPPRASPPRPAMPPPSAPPRLAPPSAAPPPSARMPAVTPPPASPPIAAPPSARMPALTPPAARAPVVPPPETPPPAVRTPPRTLPPSALSAAAAAASAADLGAAEAAASLGAPSDFGPSGAAVDSDYGASEAAASLGGSVAGHEPEMPLLELTEAAEVQATPYSEPPEFDTPASAMTVSFAALPTAAFEEPATEEAAAPVVAAPAAEVDEPPPKPLTFAEAQKLLAQSDDRNDVGQTVLRFALGKWKRCLLFGVQGNVITGWQGFGVGIQPRKVRRIGLPLTAKSTFRLVHTTRSHFIGPIAKDAGTEAFYGLLGGNFPRTAVVLPLLVRGKVVHMLYVDNGPDQFTPPDIGELLILSQAVQRSYEAMISRRKAG